MNVLNDNMKIVTELEIHEIKFKKSSEWRKNDKIVENVREKSKGWYSLNVYYSFDKLQNRWWYWENYEHKKEIIKGDLP